jgi:heme exporter protein A
MPQTIIYSSPRSLGAPDELPPAISTRELARLFGGHPALAGVSLEIQPGRIVLLQGPNGAGKTTLLRILATAIRPSFGSATVDGLDVVANAHQLRERVAYLSHASGLYDDLTARENLAFAATLLGVPAEARPARVASAIDEVGLTDVAGQRVRGFSAGMRRRLALGRILLARPSVLLLDEPFAALDAEGASLVVRLMDRWRRDGATILVASHATEHLDSRCDARVELDGGTVVDVSGAGVSWLRPIAEPARAPMVEGVA